MSGRPKIRWIIYGIYNLQTRILYLGQEKLLKQVDGCHAFAFYNCLCWQQSHEILPMPEICDKMETLLV